MSMTYPDANRTSTVTAYGINPSGHEQAAWLESINSKYLTEGNTWTGSRVPVFTSVFNQSGSIAFTGMGFLETGILQAEGYEIVSSVVTVTNCETSPTATGSSENCMPHGDHCLCPLIAAMQRTPELTPTIGHCPEGVAEPTYAPGEHEHEHEDKNASETECVAHGDHCKYFHHQAQDVGESNTSQGIVPRASQSRPPSPLPHPTTMRTRVSALLKPSLESVCWRSLPSPLVLAHTHFEQHTVPALPYVLYNTILATTWFAR